MRIFLSIVIVSLASALFAEAAPESFDRYKVILDRKPFGDPPIISEPIAPPMPNAPPWAETYRLVSVTKVEGDEVRVGIVDTKSNRALVLKVGKPEEGIEVLSADVVEESAQLSKGGEVVTMSLTAAKAGSRPQPKAAARTAPPNNRLPITPRGQSKPTTASNASPIRAPRGVLRKSTPPPPPR